MPSLAEVRQQYPQYQDLSDQQLADGLYKKFYSDLPRAAFDAKVGLASGATDSNGNSLVESFNVHLKVQKGDELAVDTTSNTAEYCADGTPGQLLFDPILAIGHGFRSAGGVDGCLMLVQAVVKH